MALTWTKTETGYTATARGSKETWTITRTKGGRFAVTAPYLVWGVSMVGTLTDCKAHVEEIVAALSTPDREGDVLACSCGRVDDHEETERCDGPVVKVSSGPDLTTPMDSKEDLHVVRQSDFPLDVEELRAGYRAEMAEDEQRPDPNAVFTEHMWAGGTMSSGNANPAPDNVPKVGGLTLGEKVEQIGKNMGGTLASRLNARRSNPTDSAPHLIIEARAGCGKTTTIVEGLKLVVGSGVTAFEPSAQQAAIWDEMKRSKGAKSIAVVAFNNTIADELRGKVPPGVQAMTTHSMGYSACRRAFPDLKLNKFRVSDIISEIDGRDIREIRRETPLVVRAIEALVSKCKSTLAPVVESDEDERTRLLTDLCDYYDIETDDERGDYRDKVFDLVPKVLGRCADVSRDNCVDFDDMVWLPIALDLPLVKYDMLCCDESQDLDRARQALVKRSGRRLVMVGDDRQAINGFAGADCESMARMRRELSPCCGGNPSVSCEHKRGVVVLPLTETRRCGKVIVKEANRYVTDFVAHPSNPEGRIYEAKYPTQGGYKDQRGEWVEKYDLPTNETYLKLVMEGDMVLCRVNAPLVSQCFRFIKSGRRANIQGRDVAAGLISTVKKLGAETIPELVGKLDDWLHREVSKEQAKRNPCEGRILTLEDRADCITAFVEGSTSVDEVVRKIENIFTNDPHAKGIKLSSIHRAKGTEANRVFILKARSIKCRPPKRQWEAVQADNLEYVAITRAVSELIYVR